jgi:hypothetical protein
VQLLTSSSCMTACYFSLNKRQQMFSEGLKGLCHQFRIILK